MSQKRKHAEVADEKGSSGRPARKKPFKSNYRDPKNRGNRPQPLADHDVASANALKSRVRDLRRLLQHVDDQPKHKMPATVRLERERELEACEHELAEKKAMAQEAERRRKMISKYHQVRFFDRQKATRICKQLKRQLAATTEDEGLSDPSSDIAQLRAKIHDAEVAIKYAIYYPLMKPYSSLYPRTKPDKEDADKEDAVGPSHGNTAGTAKGDLDIWKAIEAAMKDGTLEQLRNSDSSSGPSRTREDDDKRRTKDMIKQKSIHRASAKQQKQGSAPATTTLGADDDSDGGFFE